MTEYVVQSGTLKIVLLAETALDAAIEAVQRWGRGTKVDLDDHRQGFEERIVVQQGRGRSGGTVISMYTVGQTYPR